MKGLILVGFGDSIFGSEPGGRVGRRKFVVGCIKGAMLQTMTGGSWLMMIGNNNIKIGMQHLGF
jgi:hypothetical protein